jgi:voltage-gated potassium channel
LRFDEVEIPPNSSLVGKTIADSKIEGTAGALLVALRKGGGKDFTFNPAKTTTLAVGDVLIFIATPEMVDELAKLAG